MNKLLPAQFTQLGKRTQQGLHDMSVSYTIPKAGMVGGNSTPTRMRNKQYVEDLPATTTTTTTTTTAAVTPRVYVDPEDPVAVDADLKKRRKESYRKVSSDLARSRSEAAAAAATIDGLIEHMQNASHLQRFAEEGSRSLTYERRDSIESIESASSSMILDNDLVAAAVATAAAIPTKQQKQQPAEGGGLMQKMMALGKATKKLAIRKQELETTIVTLQGKIDHLEEEKRQLFAQLESLATRLRQEKADGAAALTALKLKYKRQLEVAEEEVASARLQMSALQASNRDLADALADKETQLLEVPRMEETYLRTARGIVRQRDRLVNEKDVKIRSMADEMSKVEFWKQKAQLYMEDVLRKEKEAAELRRQALVLGHNYREMVKQNEKLSQQVTRLSKDRSTGRPATASSWGKGTSPSPPPAGSPREGSLDESAFAATDTLMPQPQTLPGGDKLPDVTKRRPATATLTSSTANTRGAKGSTGLGATAPAVSTTAPTDAEADADFNAKEVRRLKGIIASMNETVEQLRLKLAHARAYKLLSTVDPAAAAQDNKEVDATRFIGKVYLSEMDEIFDPAILDADMDPDLDKELKAAAQTRIERAISIQDSFNARLEEIRARRPNSRTARDHLRKGRK